MFGMQQGWPVFTWGWHTIWGSGGFLMMLGTILFWTLIIGGFIYLIRGFAQRQAPQAVTTSHEVLKRRYARGEIDKVEYQAKKADLLTT